MKFRRCTFLAETSYDVSLCLKYDFHIKKDANDFLKTIKEQFFDKDIIINLWIGIRESYGSKIIYSRIENIFDFPNQYLFDLTDIKGTLYIKDKSDAVIMVLEDLL